MRFLLVFAILFLVTAVKAQTVIRNGFLTYPYAGAFTHRLPTPDSSRHSKWSFSKYISLSAGYSFSRGGGASFIAVPAGLQLNRQLSQHVFAFAGVSVAPVYTNFNGTIIPNDITKTGSGTSFYKPGSLGMYSKAELGLMYTNDARTFSISGSIGVERSSNPFYYPGATTVRQNPAVISHP